MGRIRIGLTISGAVSLGAYEGGALAALMTAVQAVPDQLRVDAVSAASAGFTFEPGCDLERFHLPRNRSAVDAGLASAANVFGFPPMQLATPTRDYGHQGIIDVPAFPRLWYSDGSAVDNEPLGRTLEM